MGYQYREGARQKLSAQIVGTELERIRESRGGVLTPEDVVEEAQPEDSPIHNGFEWDDAVAGPQYRLVQAREMIRAVVIAPEPSMGANVAPTVRAFVTIGPPPDRVYVSTYNAMADPAMRQQILDRALRELRQWRQRYQEFSELAAIFAAMDQQAA